MTTNEILAIVVGVLLAATASGFAYGFGVNRKSRALTKSDEQWRRLFIGLRDDVRLLARPDKERQQPERHTCERPVTVPLEQWLGEFLKELERLLPPRFGKHHNLSFGVLPGGEALILTVLLLGRKQRFDLSSLLVDTTPEDSAKHVFENGRMRGHW